MFVNQSYSKTLRSHLPRKLLCEVIKTWYSEMFLQQILQAYIKIKQKHISYSCESRDSSVGIATGYGLDDQRVGIRVPRGGKNFHFSISSRPALGATQPPIQWVPGALSPGVKRPGRKADHSPPTRAEVKKTWIYTSTPPYAFMA
jgi:hypothetical protein